MLDDLSNRVNSFENRKSKIPWLGIIVPYLLRVFWMKSLNLSFNHPEYSFWSPFIKKGGPVYLSGTPLLNNSTLSSNNSRQKQTPTMADSNTNTQHTPASPSTASQQPLHHHRTPSGAAAIASAFSNSVTSGGSGNPFLAALANEHAWAVKDMGLNCISVRTLLFYIIIFFSLFHFF